MELLSAILVVAPLVILYKLLSKKYVVLPGPKPLPIVGNIHQLVGTKVHHTLRKWSELYGAVLGFRVISRQYVVLSSSEAIHEALVVKSADFASRPYIYRAQVVNAGQNDIGTHPYTPLMRALKKETLRAVKAYGTGMERIESITLNSVEELIDECVQMDGKEVDLMAELYKTVINTMCVLIFGEHVPRDHKIMDRVIELDHQVASAFVSSPGALLLDAVPVSRFLGTKAWRTVQQTVKTSLRFWDDFIIPHKGEWQPDAEARGVADALFSAQAADPNITDDNVRLTLQNLVVAGSATTTNSLYAFFNILLHYPQAQKKLQAELDEHLGERSPTLADRSHLHYTRASVLELLRFMTVNPMAIPHMTTTNTTVNGQYIPKDTVCLMNLWAAHHDELNWPEPFVYRPERFLTEDGQLVAPDHPARRRLFAFGAGVRVCLGETLALNRLFLIIASLLHKFDFLPADDKPMVSCDPRDYTLTVLLEPLPYTVRVVVRK